MKYTLFIVISALATVAEAQSFPVVEKNKFADQENYCSAIVTANTITKLYIPQNATVHILSPEEINYVDISTGEVEGDLPEKNILRLKVKNSAALREGENFIVTVVTRSLLMSYQLTLSKDTLSSYVITIDPQQAIQLNNSNQTITEKDYYHLAITALGTRRSIANIRASAYKMHLWVNNIFIAGDLIILDLGAKNKSRLGYNIDEIRFKLVDKKKNNAHVSQDVELKPLYQLYKANENNSITKNWRNFYIFKKFTYPTQKLLDIEMTEMSMSGRKIKISIDYNKVLNAAFLD